MHKFIVLCIFQTHTVSYIFMCTGESLEKVIHQIINGGHFWKLKVRALYISLFYTIHISNYMH